MKIKIHNLSWEVNFVNNSSEDIISYNNNLDICGLTYKTKLKIYICKDLPEELVWRTIMHEIVHAYVWTYGFEGSPIDEETLCNFIETFSEDILSNAHKVYKYYISSVKNKKKSS